MNPSARDTVVWCPQIISTVTFGCLVRVCEMGKTNLGDRALHAVALTATTLVCFWVLVAVLLSVLATGAVTAYLVPTHAECAFVAACGVVFLIYCDSQRRRRAAQGSPTLVCTALYLATCLILVFGAGLSIMLTLSGDEFDQFHEQRGTVNATAMKEKLHEDGYVVLGDQKSLDLLPMGYEVLNYSYYIRGQTLATFHRDVTSSHYVFGTKYPTYTLIQYITPGHHLSLCPGSHRHVPFVWSLPKTISGPAGQRILFNCDVLHAGAQGAPGDRTIVQQKLAHKEDIASGLIDHLIGAHTRKDHETSQVTLVGAGGAASTILRSGSWFLSYWVNHGFTQSLQRPSGKNSFLDKVWAQWFGFYGDPSHANEKDAAQTSQEGVLATSATESSTAAAVEL